MAKITTFKTGYCTHASCTVMRGSGFAQCEFPAQVFLIEANNKLWLWDTGYSNHFEDETKGIFAIYRNMPKAYFSEREAILNQLKAQGITDNDLEGIFISHFHGDHISGLKDFPKTHFMASKKGWDYVKDKRGFSALIKAFVPGLIPENFTTRLSFIENFEKVQLSEELAPFTEGYYVPNSNKELIVVDLPGHAAGHVGIFVATETGWELIASDAAWRRENYRELIMPMRVANIIMDNSAAFKNTLQKLHQLDEKRKVNILLSHEEPRS